jgi:single-strand DNA-binding protein
MRSVNRVYLMGNIARAPELQVSKTGKPYTRLNLATNRWFNNDEGGEQKTEWHSVFVWGKQAEHCVEYLRQGARVFVEGTLTYWEVAKETDKKGYQNAVHADQITFITYGKAPDEAPDLDNLDNSPSPRNHIAVAHPG